MNYRLKLIFSAKIHTEPDLSDDDPCVLCGGKTGIERSKPIQQRTYYVEGAGQLCERRYCSTYKTL